MTLASLAAETTVILFMFLDEACSKQYKGNRLQSLSDIRDPVREEAVLRVHPKIMTATGIFLELRLIMGNEGTEADVMKHIAASMIGEMVTASILPLFVIPALFLI